MSNDILKDFYEVAKGWIDEERRARIERAHKDFFYFCKTYLPHYFTLKPASFHRQIIQALQNPKYRVMVIAAPREHAKSTLVSLAYPIWATLYKHHRFIVLFSASEETAKFFMKNIKEEFEDNEKIYNDFGDMRTGNWRSDYIELANRTAIMAKGPKGSVRGVRYRERRPDLVIIDDLEKEDTVSSPSMRESLYRWVKRVVFNLGKESRIFIIGTVLHYDSVLNRLLKEYEGKRGYFVKRYRAIENGRALWPAKWPLKALERKKEEIGSQAFATEFMNEPLADEDRMFKEEWIVYYEPEELLHKRFEIYFGVDPALGKGDYSALVIVGKDQFGIFYVLEAIGKRVTPDRFMALIIEKAKEYKPRRIGFEVVAFQKVFKDYLMEKAEREGIILPIRELKHSGLNKMARIARLSPLVENGRIRFKRGQYLLIEQLLMFPKGDHDDLPDALEMAIDVAGLGVSKMEFLLGPRRL